MFNPRLLLPETVQEQARKALARAGKKKAPADWSDEVRATVASILVSGADRKAYLSASDETLNRIELEDRKRALEIAATLRPGTTFLITDFAASPEPWSAPEFVIVATQES